MHDQVDTFDAAASWLMARIEDYQRVRSTENLRRLECARRRIATVEVVGNTQSHTRARLLRRVRAVLAP